MKLAAVTLTLLLSSSLPLLAAEPADNQGEASSTSDTAAIADISAASLADEPAGETSEETSEEPADEAAERPSALSQSVETFIPSEEIDTDKAVDFPTNI